MAQAHAVYVLYYEGAPYEYTKRAAYYTEGMANAAVTRAVDDFAGWRASDERKAEFRVKFSVEKYVKSEVAAE